MNEIAPRNSGDIMESVIVKGDLAKLTAQERAEYYAAVCRSVGLNPLTKPFEFILLNNKLQLYALRGATDQLRAIHKVSVVEMTETERDGVYIVTCKVQDGEGRTDIAKGAVALGSLKGDALANAFMRAETKSKRRATLSICGLGLLDETEIETIPEARKTPIAAPLEIASPTLAEADPETGEFGPRVLAVPKNGNNRDWVTWGRQLIAAVQAAETGEEIDQWHSLNAEMLGEAQKAAPKVWTSINKATAAALAKFTAAAEAADRRLSPKESTQLRKGLIQKLAACNSIAEIDAWRANAEEAIETLQDDDRNHVATGEKWRREQLAEVAEVLG